MQYFKEFVKFKTLLNNLLIYNLISYIQLLKFDFLYIKNPSKKGYKKN